MLFTLMEFLPEEIKNLTQTEVNNNYSNIFDTNIFQDSINLDINNDMEQDTGMIIKSNYKILQTLKCAESLKDSTYNENLK